MESVKLMHTVSGVQVETEVMREMRRASTAADGLEGQLVPGWQACLQPRVDGSVPFFSSMPCTIEGEAKSVSRYL